MAKKRDLKQINKPFDEAFTEGSKSAPAENDEWRKYAPQPEAATLGERFPDLNDMVSGTDPSESAAAPLFTPDMTPTEIIALGIEAARRMDGSILMQFEGNGDNPIEVQIDPPNSNNVSNVYFNGQAVDGNLALKNFITLNKDGFVDACNRETRNYFERHTEEMIQIRNQVIRTQSVRDQERAEEERAEEARRENERIKRHNQEVARELIEKQRGKEAAEEFASRHEMEEEQESRNEEPSQEKTEEEREEARAKVSDKALQILAETLFARTLLSGGIDKLFPVDKDGHIHELETISRQREQESPADREGQAEKSGEQEEKTSTEEDRSQPEEKTTEETKEDAREESEEKENQTKEQNDLEPDQPDERQFVVSDHLREMMDKVIIKIDGKEVTPDEFIRFIDVNREGFAAACQEYFHGKGKEKAQEAMRANNKAEDKNEKKDKSERMPVKDALEKANLMRARDEIRKCADIYMDDENINKKLTASVNGQVIEFSKWNGRIYYKLDDERIDETELRKIVAKDPGKLLKTMTAKIEKEQNRGGTNRAKGSGERAERA